MDISNLESKKLLLDLKYWKEELEIKKEMIHNMDSKFSKALYKYLDTDKYLKKEWDILSKKEEERFDNILNNSKNKNGLSDDLKDENIDENKTELEKEKHTNIPNKPEFFKKLYRDIAKQTHPDKFPNLPKDSLEKKSVQYNNATRFYDEEMYGDLLFIAYELNINFEIDDESIIHLKETLENYKKDSEFVENTYTWKWYHSNDEIKEELIKSFIINKI